MHLPLISVKFRGAVRPPFIEASGDPALWAVISGFGGQSAPPSLKPNWAELLGWLPACFGGQSAPPSLKQASPSQA